MNANRIYSQHRDDALAKQGEAPKYRTFVAMPFRECSRYHPSRVMQEVIVPAAQKASQSQPVGGKRFARPTRVDEAPQVAKEISEEIIVAILNDHLFLADLTTLNENVLLELGIALGLKPTPQILLLLDGDPAQLPFDIKDNAVIRYDTSGAVGRVAQALLTAAKAFEQQYRAYVTEVAKHLTSDAIFALRLLGQMHPQRINGDVAAQIFPGDSNPRLRYNFVEKELLLHRLVWMKHKVVHGGDSFELHPTALGRRVIELKWPKQAELPGARQQPRRGTQKRFGTRGRGAA